GSLAEGLAHSPRAWLTRRGLHSLAEGLAHHRDGRRDPQEALERDGALVEEHPEAIDGAEPPRPRLPEDGRLERRVDQIGDGRATRESRHGERRGEALGVGAPLERRARRLNEEVGLLERGLERVEADGGERAWHGGGQRTNERLRRR